MQRAIGDHDKETREEGQAAFGLSPSLCLFLRAGWMGGIVHLRRDTFDKRRRVAAAALLQARGGVFLQLLPLLLLLHASQQLSRVVLLSTLVKQAHSHTHSRTYAALLSSPRLSRRLALLSSPRPVRPSLLLLLPFCTLRKHGRTGGRNAVLASIPWIGGGGGRRRPHSVWQRQQLAEEE